MNSVLADLAARARRELDPVVVDYYEGGSGQEVTLAHAEAAWQRWALRPRVLRDVSTVDTSGTLVGQRISHPVLVAPTAFHRLAHADGEVATAHGARAARSLLVLSTRSTRRFADVAAVGAPWWLQVYMTKKRSVTEGLVTDAAGCGASALVLTADAPLVANKARASRAMPLSNTEAMVNTGPYLAAGDDPEEATEQDPALGIEDIEWLADCSGLPVLVKGVLRADDARTFVDAGAAGIVVSNHGGRQLDRALPTALALPDVVQAVGAQVPVLVDGGIRSGHDVLTALALGASAVLLGRPVLWGLAVDGAAGVERALRAVVDELAEVMALAGATRIGDVDRSLVTLLP